MANIKNCLLCKNYKTHPCECEHCEDWDNFRISESGKALRKKIYGDGYKDGYDKGYDDAQRPQGKWINTGSGQECNICHEIQYGYDNFRHFCANCGADMREGSAE